MGHEQFKAQGIWQPLRGQEVVNVLLHALHQLILSISGQAKQTSGFDELI